MKETRRERKKHMEREKSLGKVLEPSQNIFIVCPNNYCLVKNSYFIVCRHSKLQNPVNFHNVAVGHTTCKNYIKVDARTKRFDLTAMK